MTKGLFIGINYAGTSNELYGCINDINTINKTYQEVYGLKKEDTIILLEEQATKKNIMNAINWLVSNNKPDDQLLFHFSGHGSQINDVNGDEYDFKDDLIIPFDYMNGVIIYDDELKIHLVDRVGSSYLVAIMDCCHSGSAMDLNYVIDDGFIRKLRNSTEYPKLNCVMVSGCKDNQKSDDALIDNKFSGALTYYFNKIIRLKPNISFIDLYTNLTDLIAKKGYSQRPVMSFNSKPHSITDTIIRV